MGDLILDLIALKEFNMYKINYENPEYYLDKEDIFEFFDKFKFFEDYEGDADELTENLLDKENEIYLSFYNREDEETRGYLDTLFIKLADEDSAKVEKVKKIIDQNFDLSPRGIREMLRLNNPIYEVTSAYGHFGRKPTNKGEFSWEKTDKVELFNL